MVWDDGCHNQRGEDDAKASCGGPNKGCYYIKPRCTASSPTEGHYRPRDDKGWSLAPDVGRAECITRLMDRDEEEESSESHDDEAEPDYDELDPPRHNVFEINQARPCLTVDETDEHLFVAHRLTGTLHLVKDQEKGLLVCGRKMTIALQLIEPTEVDAPQASFSIQCNSVYRGR